MPFGDGTGPLGQGPMTGRGLGYCTGFNRAGYSYPGRGRGWFGRGRGWRNWVRADYRYPAYAPVQPTVKEERETLEGGVKALREELKDLETRLQELKTKKGK